MSKVHCLGKLCLLVVPLSVVLCIRNPEGGGPSSAARLTASSIQSVALGQHVPPTGVASALAAIALDPDNDRAHESIHAAYELMGRTASLPDLYDELAAARPEAVRLRLEFGRALFRAGERARAVAVFDRLLGGDSHFREARRLRGLTLLEMGEAARAAEDLAALKPLDTGTARYLGVAFVLSGRPNLGAEVLREVISKDPSCEASYFLAKALRASGERAEAEEILRALVMDPRAPADALADLADLQLDPTDPARFQPDFAIQHAEAALERGVACYDILARAYASVGEAEMALATAEAGLEDAATGPAARERCHEFIASVTGSSNAQGR